MAVSKFGFKDWLLGWVVPSDVGTASIQAVTLVDTTGNSTYLAAGQATRAASSPTAESTEGILALTAPYPQGATPVIAASGNVAAAVAAATLAAAVGRTTYISGFEITGAGATIGAVVSVTVTGILGGTLTYTYNAIAGALLPNTPIIVRFAPPLPGSATNTAIVVSCPSLGTGNTNNTTVAHGYQF